MPRPGKAIFRNSVQTGLFTIFKSNTSRPLELWDLVAENGAVSQFIDPQIRSMVFNITGANVSTTYITCPKGDDVLGIHMPFFVIVAKNLHKYFNFELTIMDDDHVRRRFRCSNFQTSTVVNPLHTAMPICLADGWNQIMFNLADFTRRAYGRSFCEVLKVKINANICLRRVYFAERIIPDDELPREYKIYLPITQKRKVPKRPSVPPASPPHVIYDNTNIEVIHSHGPIQEDLKMRDESRSTTKQYNKSEERIIDESDQVATQQSVILNASQSYNKSEERIIGETDQVAPQQSVILNASKSSVVTSKLYSKELMGSQATLGSKSKEKVSQGAVGSNSPKNHLEPTDTIEAVDDTNAANVVT